MRLRLDGRISATTVPAGWFTRHRRDTALMMNPPGGVITGRDEGHNVTCTAGLTVLAAALVWSGIQDQAASLGVTTPAYLTPLYGAVGSGAGTVNAADTALFSELSRQPAGAGAAAPATPSLPAITTFLFYFPAPLGAWTVTEAGAFANASSATGSGVMLDHYAFGSPITVPPTDTLILQLALSVAGS